MSNGLTTKVDHLCSLIRRLSISSHKPQSWFQSEALTGARGGVQCWWPRRKIEWKAGGWALHVSPHTRCVRVTVCGSRLIHSFHSSLLIRDVKSYFFALDTQTHVCEPAPGGLAGGMGTLMCVSHFVFPLTGLDSRERSAVLLLLLNPRLMKHLDLRPILYAPPRHFQLIPGPVCQYIYIDIYIYIYIDIYIYIYIYVYTV